MAICHFEVVKELEINIFFFNFFSLPLFLRTDGVMCVEKGKGVNAVYYSRN